MDFLVHTTSPCAYDEEIRDLGSRIIPCPTAHQPWRYGADVQAALSQFGSYDVVHSHLHHFTGITLRIAQRAKIPVRIAHSHNDLAQTAKPHRRLYLALMKRWIRQFATQGLACSQRAAAALYGPQWEQDSRWKVLYYGLDLEPFQGDSERDSARLEFDIPVDAYVIGHVGRFVDQKNHRFLLEIWSNVVRQLPQTYLILVGDGPLKSQVQAQADQLGLSAQIRFAGLRNDVPRLMRSVMDHFLFPSNFEGLGLALVEAQAAGLPCLCSAGIPPEVTVIPELLARLDLTEPAPTWADRLITQQQRTPAEHRKTALQQVISSPFNIQTAVKNLEAIYISAARLPRQPIGTHRNVMNLS